MATRTTKTTTEEVTPVEEVVEQPVQSEAKETEPKAEKPTPKTPEYSDTIKQKLALYEYYGGSIKPILIAYGIFEYVPFDYSKTAKEQVLKLFEHYKSDIFYDEELLKAQIKRKYAIYNGVLEDDTPEEHIKYNIETFFNGIHRHLFTGIGIGIDVYYNIYTHELKYSISYI